MNSRQTAGSHTRFAQHVTEATRKHFKDYAKHLGLPVGSDRLSSWALQGDRALTASLPVFPFLSLVSGWFHYRATKAHSREWLEIKGLGVGGEVGFHFLKQLKEFKEAAMLAKTKAGLSGDLPKLRCAPSLPVALGRAGRRCNGRDLFEGWAVLTHVGASAGGEAGISVLMFYEGLVHDIHKRPYDFVKAWTIIPAIGWQADLSVAAEQLLFKTTATPTYG